jgi:hypothetical protein
MTNIKLGTLAKRNIYAEKLVVTENKLTEDQEIFVAPSNGRSAICRVFTNNNSVKSREQAMAYAELFASSIDMYKALFDIVDGVESGILKSMSPDSLFYKFAKESIKNIKL